MATSAPITAELIRRCEAYGMDATTTILCRALGAAVDSGIVQLGDLVAMVRSCNTADELGDKLVMLAAWAELPVGCPPGHEHRTFRITGEVES